LQTHPHGGWCCGVTHLQGFDDPKIKAIKHTQYARRGQKFVYKEDVGYRWVDDPAGDFVEWKSEPCNKTNEQVFDESVEEFRGGVLEVILTDDFLTENRWGKFWADKLKKAGFELVSRFTNTNSGNVCNVFHLYKVDVPEGSPPNWE
jgi:hypothetical protein